MFFDAMMRMILMPPATLFAAYAFAADTRFRCDASHFHVATMIFITILRYDYAAISPFIADIDAYAAYAPLPRAPYAFRLSPVSYRRLTRPLNKCFITDTILFFADAATLF